FNRLAHQYAVLTGYGGIAHPSLPNYLALVSGSTQGIHDDCDNCSTGASNLADLLEARGRTWKTYAAGLPAPGYAGGNTGSGRQPGLPGGRVPALAVGPTVRPGARTRARLDHYNLLRTIEDAFRLPRLGRSAGAKPITGIWR